MIPVNTPLISKKDIESVSRSLKKGWISSEGPDVIKFEKKFSKFIQKKFCSSVANGTAALEIAVKALGIKKNDEVIIPNFTIVSNALAVLRQNAIPIPIDCDLENWNMKIHDIEKKITKKTKAIIATHIYGYPLEIDKIIKICKKFNLFLIEDAAEMIGHHYKKKMCGSFGDISTFSFYANKHITTGEGGMIATNSKKLDKKIKSLRNLCFGKVNRFNHDDYGWNYRFTNIQAALGLSQLKNINKIVNKKKEIGKIYYEKLKNNKSIFIQKPKLNSSENIYWVVGILIKKKKNTAQQICKKLKKCGIQTRPFFWPIHKQTFLKKINIRFKGYFPNSEYLSKYGFYLPSGIGLSHKKINFICRVLNQLI